MAYSRRAWPRRCSMATLFAGCGNVPGPPLLEAQTSGLRRGAMPMSNSHHEMLEHRMPCYSSPCCEKLTMQNQKTP